MEILADYQALQDHAILGEISPRGQLAVAGSDRASYLQGLLTNDIQALGAGSGCYAAWLTPQGRLLTDMHVLESGDMILLDLPLALVQQTLERLDQFLFSEDVQLSSLVGQIQTVWIHGPEAASLLERTLSGISGLDAFEQYQNRRATFRDASAVVARIDQLGVPGYCVFIEPAQAEHLAARLRASGAVAASGETIEAARIEAGTPIFGLDMNTDTIPLEAGIEHRAISLTKGCYVGQEVIIRVLHRGGGRVAKKLVTLSVAAEQVPAAGAKVWSGDREIGRVTSGARSPRRGTLVLAYLHRDFLEPGTAVDVELAGGRAGATVTRSPRAS